METQSLLSLPSLPLFLSRSPSINCSTSYLQEASISQETNVISKLCMSPSGWKEAVLLLLLGFWGFFFWPHNRSEASKMLLVNQKCWPFPNDSKIVAKSDFSALQCLHCGIRTDSEKGQIRSVCVLICMCVYMLLCVLVWGWVAWGLIWLARTDCVV